MDEARLAGIRTFLEQWDPDLHPTDTRESRRSFYDTLWALLLEVERLREACAAAEQALLWRGPPGPGYPQQEAQAVRALRLVREALGKPWPLGPDVAREARDG